MIVEKIIAKKDVGDFFNYTILFHHNKYSYNSGLQLLIDLVRTTVLRDVFDYENGVVAYQYGSSDEWSVRYGERNQAERFYIEFYDYWTEQDATEIIGGVEGLMLDKLKGLKIMTQDNLLQIIKSWQAIYKQRPEYIIITQYDNGLIYLEGKQELSDHDFKIVNSSNKHMS